MHVGIFKAQIKEGQLVLSEDENTDGPVFRGKLVNNNTDDAPEILPYILWAKRGGQWFETPFAFDQFGTANSSMKSMISGYEAMAIVYAGEEEKPVKQYKKQIGGLSLLDD